MHSEIIYGRKWYKNMSPSKKGFICIHDYFPFNKCVHACFCYFIYILHPQTPINVIVCPLWAWCVESLHLDYTIVHAKAGKWLVEYYQQIYMYLSDAMFYSKYLTACSVKAPPKTAISMDFGYRNMEYRSIECQMEGSFIGKRVKWRRLHTTQWSNLGFYPLRCCLGYGRWVKSWLYYIGWVFLRNNRLWWVEAVPDSQMFTGKRESVRFICLMDGGHVSLCSSCGNISRD